MKIIKAMAISLALIFAGCASVPTTELQTAYQYDKSHSKAWNIATAAGLKNIKDYVVTDHTDRNALALGGAYAAASHFAGVGFSPADIGFGLLGSIATSGQIPAEGRQHIFIWMPAGLEETPLAARAKAMDIVTAAIEQLLPKYTEEKIRKTRTINAHFSWDHDSDVEKTTYCFKPCVEEKTWFKPVFGEKFIIYGNSFKPLWVNLWMPILHQSPQFIGEYEGWNFNLLNTENNGYVGGLAMPSDKNSVLYDKDMEFRLALSSILPKYVYFYMPATTTHGPFIVNQGKPLYFIQP